MRSRILAIFGLLVSLMPQSGHADDFGFLPKNAGQKLNNLFRDQGLTDRFYFVECKRWPVEKVYICEYDLGKAKFSAIADGPYSPVSWLIVTSDYDGEGYDDLETAGTAVMMLAVPVLDILDAHRMVVDGIDRSGDKAHYMTRLNGLSLFFDRSIKLNRVRMSIRPVKNFH